MGFLTKFTREGFKGTDALDAIINAVDELEAAGTLDEYDTDEENELARAELARTTDALDALTGDEELPELLDEDEELDGLNRLESWELPEALRAVRR